MGTNRAIRISEDPRLFNLSELHAATSRGRPRYIVETCVAEIEEALVPAFIIEELEDGRFTVFVPSVPTPLAGAVYILTSDRVHPLNVPFTQAIKAVSRWGEGAKDLAAAMETPPPKTPLHSAQQFR